MDFDNRVTGDSHVSKNEKTCLTILMKCLFYVELRVYTHLHVLLFDHAYVNKGRQLITLIVHL